MKYLLVIFLIFLVELVFAFDVNKISSLLANEIKKSPINEEVSVGQIKFIGPAPNDLCEPENVKIREIKRPSSIEFTFSCGKKLYRAVANYEILSTVYITKKTIIRGDTIQEEALLEIKQPINRIPVGSITDKKLIIGKVAKRTLAQGLIIKEEHIYPNTPVKKGSRVNLIIQAGKVIIMTEGVLKSDAVVGSKASVHCLQTGKDIVGNLVDNQTVRVML